MSTICADELLYDEGRVHAPRETGSRVRSARVRAERLRRPGPATADGRRYEDFEARSTDLADILGGQVFPRVF